MLDRMKMTLSNDINVDEFMQFSKHHSCVSTTQLKSLCTNYNAWRKWLTVGTQTAVH